MNFIIENIDLILQILAALAAVILGLPWVKTKRLEIEAIIENKNLDRLAGLAQGVCIQIYTETVRLAKAEGKFTPELKKAVFDEAVASLTKAAKEEGIEIAKDLLPALVEWAVNKLKGEGSFVGKSLASVPISQPTPQPELPDLEAMD